MRSEVAFLGFGEAAATFLKGWRRSIDVTASAYDIKTTLEGRAKKLQDYEQADVRACETCEQLLAGTKVVFSLVTADQALEVAREASKAIVPGTLYFDGNSCAPQSKQEAGQLIEAVGARYVDLAIMAPVDEDVKKTPLFLSGPHADEAYSILWRLGVRARLIDGDIGAASFVKMMRSIMVKGLEALSAECFLAAQKAGVFDLVMESLDASYPAFDWQNRSAYMIERSTRHGIRRAAELEEVKRTIQGLGLPDWMADASASWQHRLGELQMEFAENEETSRSRMSAVLQMLKEDG